MQQKDKRKLLAFITMVKLNRSNSVVLYSNEAKSKRASELHYNYNTFKKNINLCISEGLIKTTKNGHLQVVKMQDCITYFNDGVVDTKNLTFNKHVLFFRYFKYDENTKLTPKIIYEQITKSLILRNYAQQQHCINKNQYYIDLYETSFYCTNLVREKSFTKSDRSLLNKLSKVAGKLNLSTSDYIKILKEKHKAILSGKYHVADIVEMSTSTGSRYLTKLAKKEISREVIKLRRNLPLNQANYELLQAEYPKAKVVPSHVMNCFFIYKGSEIGLNKNLDFMSNNIKIKKTR